MQAGWKTKVFNHKLTLSGIFFIGLMSVLALFAYVVIDDPTSNANEQNAEISLKPAGFTTQVIRLKTNQDKKTGNFLTGYKLPYKEYPIKDAQISEDGMIITTHFDQKSIISLQSIYNDEIRSKTYWLGTDRFGRSIISRLILGVRISLLVGLLAVLISLTVGVTLGAIAGYFGGKVDIVVMYLINVMWSIPTLLLVFAIVLAFGRGLSIIFLAVGLTMWVDVARIVRGQVKSIKNELYVQAAISIGQRHMPIIFKHILPNIVGPILVISAANFATAILIEAGLSYLGFGVKPPTPSIGNMLNEHYGYAIAGKPMLAVVPAVMIMLLVLAFNVVGSGLRDIFDVKRVD